MRLHARLFAFLFVFAAAACSGDGSTGPTPVASVSITLPSGSIAPGTSVQLTAELKDAKGNALSGRSVSWNSSNTAVATISGAGMLQAIAAGTTTITATAEGKTASQQMTVVPPPVASVTVTAPNPTMFQGTTQTLQVTLRDANNVELTGRSRTFTSSATSVASVNQSGVVNGIAVGEATITVTSEGKTGTVGITVLPRPAPVISSVSPSVLQYGVQATLQGEHFAGDVFGNIVRVNGVQVQVASATSTEIRFNVPCAVSGPVSITVTRGGLQSESFTAQNQAPQLVMAVGESQVFTSAAAGVCNEFAATAGNARYLLTVFNVSSSGTLQVPVQVQGVSAAAGNMQYVPFALRDVRAVQETQLERELRQFEREHMRHLERERQQYAAMRASGLMAQARVAAMQTTAQAVPQVGQSRNFSVIGIQCNSTSPVAQTKAIYVGTRGIIWEDQNNPILAANHPELASYYQRLGQIFDTDQYESVRDNFGDPLLRDAQLINEGRVHMVFTIILNSSGSAAYVTSCDQYPKSQAAGSNFGPTFYARVPTLNSSSLGTTNSPPGWFAFMARTVVHETKHVASHAARFANGFDWEEGWLEEGTARIAEEMWVRESLHKVAWKANTGFGTAANNGLYCDFHLTDATCNAADPLRRPSWGLRRQLDEINDKLFQPWAFSPFNSQDGGVYYNTTWSLVRYAIDRFGASDADFLRALTSSSQTGMNNLLTVAGTTGDQLLGGWGMALFADDYPGMPKTDATQFQTWNLRSIYNGLHQSPSWSNTYNTPFPITPTQLNAGNFTTETVNIVGGGHAFFELTTAAPQLIQIKAPGTGLLHPDVRLAIVRLQ